MSGACGDLDAGEVRLHAGQKARQLSAEDMSWLVGL